MAAGAVIRYTSADLAAFGNRQGVRAMLDLLPRFAELSLSNNAAWLPRIAAAPLMGADNPRLTPHDPTTLALAIVGIVTLAVYYAAIGWRKPRHDEGRTSRPKLQASDRRRSADQSDTPTRGAA
jgi:hypothetical protein